MHRYKKSGQFPTISRQDKSIVGSLAVAAIHQTFQNQAPDVITTVPSTQGRKDHPLHHLVSQAGVKLGIPTQIDQLLQVNPDALPLGRKVSSEAFTVTKNLAAKHILLIDDTWTTGAHMLSAVGALHTAGAAQITAIALARWLGSDNSYHQSEIMKHARQNPPRFADYDFFAEPPRTSLF
ncbi:hypothetical protein M3B03_04655 [Corynebacterium pseudodiphtheriticum]|uniref:ComF family protein n=1 Tax=Corynebacterium pseudodiphtheriticum TaxID=37637 RepID=UPI00223AFF01|nr:hypothetical protein [Corynebacterium pseudodiphtheriticum]MCT1634992.1 hypothetical protein [Corynebacterium pseudodiphtheriticum]MCT1666085.1 hypothetical protein [Corynebacterium pseudodiphtheriticum]